MRDYIIKRILLGVLTLIGVSILIFLLMRVLPGDVANVILGEGRATEADLADIRQKLGLDKPLYVQYLNWVSGLLRLDAGDSLKTGFPITRELMDRFPVSFELATLTLVFASLLAVPLGVLSAVRQGSWIDQALRIVSVGGLAMPTFWTGTIIILLLVVLFNWTPPLGFVGLFEDPLDNLQQIVWPAFVLGYYYTAVVSRMTRSCMLEVLRQDYIRTAWSKGLRERAVIFRHALKNAMLPVVTIMGIQYAYLMGGTVIMETIFFLPGMGSALVDSILFRDYPMVQAIFLVFAAVIFLANLAIDLLYAALDPRVRLG